MKVDLFINAGMFRVVEIGMFRVKVEIGMFRVMRLACLECEIGMFRLKDWHV